MKIRSFTVSLLVLIVFSMNLIGCGTSPVSPTLTPLPTQTSTPTAAPTKTETPTPEPTKTPSPEELSQMTDEEKLAKGPEIQGLTKSSISRVKNNLIIYRDNEGQAQVTFDLLTGKELNLPDAGIVEFVLESGETMEMPAFIDDIPTLSEEDLASMTEEEIQAFKAAIMPAEKKLLEKAFAYMVESGVDWGNLGPHFIENETAEGAEFAKNIWLIPGFHKHITGWNMPRALNIVNPADHFVMRLGGVQYEEIDGVFINYWDGEGTYNGIFVSVNESDAITILKDPTFIIPPNPSPKFPTTVP